MGKKKEAKKIAKKRIKEAKQKRIDALRDKTYSAKGYAYGINLEGSKKDGKRMAQHVMDEIVGNVPDGYRIDGCGVYLYLSPTKRGKADHVDLHRVEKSIGSEPDLFDSLVILGHPSCDVKKLVDFCSKLPHDWMNGDDFGNQIAAEMVDIYIKAVNDAHPDNETCQHLILNGLDRGIRESDVINILKVTGIPYRLQVVRDDVNGDKYRIVSDVDAAFIDWLQGH